MNSFDGILMSPFAISVSRVPISSEEEPKTELELSRFAMSDAGPNSGQLSSSYEDDVVRRSSLLFAMTFSSHKDCGALRPLFTIKVVGFIPFFVRLAFLRCLCV